MTRNKAELTAQIAAAVSAIGIFVTTVIYLVDTPLSGAMIGVFAVGSLVINYGGFFTAVIASTIYKEAAAKNGVGMMKLGVFLLGVFVVLGIGALMVASFSRGAGVVGPSASIAILSGAIGLAYVVIGYSRRILKAVEGKSAAGN